MRLIVNDNLAQYTQEQLDKDMALLPTWRREQALRYRHFQGQRDCTLSYLLLCQALEEEYGITDKPTFLVGEHGKPSLQEHPGIHFNMSHCANAIACAVGRMPIALICCFSCSLVYMEFLTCRSQDHLDPCESCHAAYLSVRGNPN